MPGQGAPPLPRQPGPEPRPLTLGPAPPRLSVSRTPSRSPARGAAWLPQYGKTPLIWAAAGGHEPVATALLRGGADLRAADRSGWDALLAACHAGHARLATVWLQGADLRRAARDGTTCLHAAARGGHAALVQQLLRSGADPAAQDSQGQRPLERARAAGHTAVVAALVDVTPEAPPPPPPAARMRAALLAGASAPPWLVLTLALVLAAVGVVMASGQ